VLKLIDTQYIEVTKRTKAEELVLLGDMWLLHSPCEKRLKLINNQFMNSHMSLRYSLIYNTFMRESKQQTGRSGWRWQRRHVACQWIDITKPLQVKFCLAQAGGEKKN
jgi:hypothetical protein